MPTSKDLLQNSVSDDALGFADVYTELMDEKISSAVEEMRLSIAEGIYGSGEEVQEEAEAPVEVSEEGLDESDDEDLEDLDLDLEDLDLEEDLEELGDTDAEEDN